MKIIYPQTDETGDFNGMISVIHPSPDWSARLPELARKDVPQGLPFLIVEDDAVPNDRTFRAAWEADFSTPHGYGDPAGYWAEIEAAQSEVSA